MAVTLFVGCHSKPSACGSGFDVGCHAISSLYTDSRGLSEKSPTSWRRTFSPPSKFGVSCGDVMKHGAGRAFAGRPALRRDPAE